MAVRSLARRGRALRLWRPDEGDVEVKGSLKRGIKLLMERQQANGEWLQEGIEGVFNKSW